VDAAFSDIEALAGSCRFRDFRHHGEPGCAVVAAVHEGALDPARLDSFLRLTREVERLAERADPGRRREKKAADRRFARLVRAEVRRKNRR